MHCIELKNRLLNEAFHLRENLSILTPDMNVHFALFFRTLRCNETLKYLAATFPIYCAENIGSQG